jgi:putative membrane protein
MYYWTFLGTHFFWWMFWVALMAVFFATMRPVSRRRVRFYEHPLSVLQRRYAAGEITTQEYEERKTRIDKDSRELEHRSAKGLPFDRRHQTT